ncbi:unnamed protein product [Lactuca virosa]|uniref:Serine/threonine-protein kinase TOR n=1 Tax=Lactuca virosa TaxID=75947 RepID=A0AAU9MM65_9ASTR|nr:unnamed protein product [Lactuca virosa]
MCYKEKEWDIEQLVGSGGMPSSHSATLLFSPSYFKLPGKRSGGGEVVPDETLRPQLMTLLPCIFSCVRHSHVAVRLSASRCITSMAKSIKVNIMGSVIENIIPMLGDMASVNARQGAGMIMSLLVQGLGTDLVPYARMLVVPLLRLNACCLEVVESHPEKNNVLELWSFFDFLMPGFLGTARQKYNGSTSGRLPERLEKEVHDLLPPSISNGIRVITSPYGADSAWYGAKLLSNLSTFPNSWLSIIVHLLSTLGESGSLASLQIDLVLFVLTFTLDAYIVTKEWHVVVRVDYIPSRVDLPALGHGKYVELVNPFQWKLSWKPSTVVLDWHLLVEDIVYVFLCCYCGFGNILLLTGPTVCISHEASVRTINLRDFKFFIFLVSN